MARAAGLTCCCRGRAGRVFVEVKSVTLCRGEGQGAFPDAVSERGRKHLLELQAVLARDTRALLFFCAFHTGIRRRQRGRGYRPGLPRCAG